MESIQGNGVLLKLRHKYSHELRALQQECLWLISNDEFDCKSGLLNNKARLLQFVSMMETLLCKVRSMGSVPYDESMEQPLRALEDKIIKLILPVRTQLHNQWKCTASGAISGTDTESNALRGPGAALFLSHLSTSALSRGLLHAGVPLLDEISVNGNNFPLLNIVSGVVVEKKESKADSEVKLNVSVGKVSSNSSISTEIKVDSTTNRAKRAKAKRISTSRLTTSGANRTDNTESVLSQESVLSHVFDDNHDGDDESLQDLMHATLDTELSPGQWGLQELDSTMVSGECQKQGSVVSDVSEDAAMVVRASASASVSVIRSSEKKRSFSALESSEHNTFTPKTSASSSCGSLNTTHSSTCNDRPTPLTTLTHTTSTSSATTSNHSVSHSDTAVSCARTTANAAEALHERRLRQVVPYPRLPRSADYTCSLCTTPYTITVHDNPWFAVYRHKCVVCKLTQVPCIDISAPINAVELDPNNAALYGEGLECDEVSTECSVGSVEGSAVGGEENSARGAGSCDVSEVALHTTTHNEPHTMPSATTAPTLASTPLTTDTTTPTPTSHTLVPLQSAPDEVSKLLVLIHHVRTCTGEHKTLRHAEVCARMKSLLAHVHTCHIGSVASISYAASINSVGGVSDGMNSVISGCSYPWCAQCKRVLQCAPAPKQHDTCTKS